jgi:hypothetical protein
MAAERKIGGVVYRCEEMPAADAVLLFGEFAKLFDPYSMQAIRQGMNRKLACENYLALSANSPSPADLQDFLRRAVELCTVKNEPCIVGITPNSLADFAEVAFFALEVQFKSFLLAALDAPSSVESVAAA